MTPGVPYLRCDDCRRDATQQPKGIDAILAAIKDDEEREARASRVVLCNVHVGSEKRSRWPRISKTWEPMSTATRDLAIAYRNRLREEERKRDEEREAERHQNARNSAVRYWAEEANAEQYMVRYSEEQRSAGLRRVWSVVTVAVNAAIDADPDENRFHNTEAQVIIEDFNSYDDVTYPVAVETRGSSRVSPKAMPAIIEAMTYAHKAAVAINARRLQTHNRNVSDVAQYATPKAETDA